MNFTIGVAQRDQWKRIKPRYLLAAAGAVVLAGVLAAGFNVREASSPAPSPTGAHGVPVLSESRPDDLAVYIVGSPAEKTALEQELLRGDYQGWFAEGAGGLSNVRHRVVVIEPGAEESLDVLAGLLPEAGLSTGGGGNLALFDLR